MIGPALSLESPTLGVITCSRADFDGLKRTLDSLLSANDVFKQHILVLSEYSDCQIRNLKEHYSEIGARFILLEPSGIYQAMNLGLEEIQTDFVLFLNGGDELNNGKALEQLKNDLKPDGWGYGGIQISQASTALTRRYHFTRYNKWLHRFGIKYVPHPSTVFSVKKIRYLGGYNVSYKTGADQDLISRFAMESKPAISKEYISKFYLGGQSSRSNLEIIQELKRISLDNHGYTLNLKLIDDILWSIVSAARSFVKPLLSRIRQF